MTRCESYPPCFETIYFPTAPFFILLKKANAFIFSYSALEVRPPFFQSVAFSHTHQN